jgi:hypothetical protein
LPFYGAAIPRDFRPQVLPEAFRRTIAPMTLIPTGETRVAQSVRRHVADTANARGRLVRIEVSNGNGVRSMARNVGNFLKEKDIVLMYLSNATHFNHGASKIFYTDGYLPQARRLAGRLPGEQQLESVTSIRGGQAEISILIGKDLISHSNRFVKV